MKITLMGPNHIKAETDRGQDFEIYSLVGGGLEIYPIAGTDEWQEWGRWELSHELTERGRGHILRLTLKKRDVPEPGTKHKGK